MAFYGQPVLVNVPDTVQAGLSFQVLVRTYGNDCVSDGGTKVRESSLFADITPYDVIYTGPSVCDDILKMIDHQATVTLQKPGVAQIRIRGKQMLEDSLVIAVREVVVEQG